MSVYTLVPAQTAVQTVANVGWQNPVVEPDGQLASSPPIEQAFIVTVTGSGNVSASAQIVGSNDTVNWALYGPAIAVASGASPQSQSAVGNIPYQFYSAFLTAISGTGAKATVTMAC